MASGPKNAAPQFINNGWEDNSRRNVDNEPMQVATHTALVLLRSSWGPENDQLVAGGSLLNMYGSDLFNERSPYFTHQNYLAANINAAGNSLLVKRIVPRDAPAPSAVCLWLDYVAEQLTDYERNSDGSYKVDANGARIPLPTKIDGYRYVLYLDTLQNADASLDGVLGQQHEKVGRLTNEAGEQSTAVPIFELARPHRGKAGRRGGFRLSAPTMLSPDATQDDIVEAWSAFLYRLSFVERPDDTSGPILKPTIAGESSVTFTFKEGVYDTKTEVEYGIDQVLVQSYNQPAIGDDPQIFGTFSKYHVYQDNLETVLKLFQANELPYGNVGDDEDDFHMFNFVTAVGYTGVPYYTVQLDGPSAGGVLFSESSTYYALGGGDGTLSAAEYDEGVADFLNGFATSELGLTDNWRVPMSVIYDSGFSLETKLRFPQLLAARDDIYVVMSTQDYNEPQNTEEEDYSIGLALKNALRSYPESVLFGTGVCRGAIVAHAGQRYDTKLRGMIPLVNKVASDSAQYMGRADAIWNSELAPDEPDNNVVSGYVDINVKSKTDTMRDRFWDASIIWAQYKDRRDIFIPAYQTVYDDDTSVLNGFFNMVVCVDIVKVARGVWTELVGRTKFKTRQQFIDRSDTLLAQRVRDRYDGRVTIVPQTSFTEQDIKRGFAWTTKVNVYMNGLLTVENFTLTANRMDDLAQLPTA